MLLQIDGSTDVVVRDITMLDSPRFNLYLGSYCKRVLVERVTILADWEAQTALQQKSVPMFPFNTDGIDVAGEDITIRDIVVSNYDDVVAVKTADLLPSSADGVVPGCTRNITVSNTTVYRGAGLSVGSVHPSPLKPCVRDVLFERATLWSPLKGPYVKPDRATPECLHLDHDACSASIQNVTYKHVRPPRSLSGECTDTPRPSPRLAFPTQACTAPSSTGRRPLAGTCTRVSIARRPSRPTRASPSSARPSGGASSRSQKRR